MVYRSLLNSAGEPMKVRHLPGQQRPWEFRHLKQLDNVRATVTYRTVGAVRFPHHDQITAGLFENGP
jgi:hypothetical protein